ncbi:MAG: hypothetical protein E6L02_07410 [Thaumarchaeota archaeon]|nr:MAG: hypothetical protein E6L02_07410 [Nitrososphaerota archaeon]
MNPPINENLTVRDVVNFLLKYCSTGYCGDGDIKISGCNSAKSALENELTFATTKEYLMETTSKIVIIGRNLLLNGQTKTLIVVKNPKLEFVRVITQLFKAPNPPKITIGKGCSIHTSAIIGKEGFNYVQDYDGTLLHFPHFGGVTIGDNVDIGPNTEVDRGVFDDTIIESGTKIDGLVHIAHNTHIGRNCFIVAGTVIGGSCEIGDGVVLGIGAQLKQYTKVGKGAVVGMGSVVLNDVAENMTVAGIPAKVLQTNKKMGGII